MYAIHAYIGVVPGRSMGRQSYGSPRRVVSGHCLIVLSVLYLCPVHPSSQLPLVRARLPGAVGSTVEQTTLRWVS